MNDWRDLQHGGVIESQPGEVMQVIRLCDCRFADGRLLHCDEAERLWYLVLEAILLGDTEDADDDDPDDPVMAAWDEGVQAARHRYELHILAVPINA